MKTIFLVIGMMLATAHADELVESKTLGHFGLESVQHDQMTELDRMYYWSVNQKNLRKLQAKGLIKSNKSLNAPPLFDFPLRTSSNDPGFYGISNFVDLDANFPGSILDYNCGSRSYDLSSGYNHQGIDIFLWPFGWDQMDRSLVSVQAAADGIITAKFDGNIDRNCTFNNNQWNAVFVTHADGSVVYYGHMKRNSLTTKVVGDSVVKGEFLGLVGSSGSSTAPHLHLETYNSLGQLVEPYAGSCNNLNANSWWQSQTPYYDSKIVKVATHAVAPTFPSCPITVDDPQFKDDFVSGDTVYLARYYQDQLQAQNSNMIIRRPDGTVFENWNQASTVVHYIASFWYNSIILPTNSQPGEWLFEVTFEGNMTTHKFFVNSNIFSDGFE